MSELIAFNYDKDSVYIKLFPFWIHILYINNLLNFNVGFLILSLSFSASITENEFN